MKYVSLILLAVTLVFCGQTFAARAGSATPPAAPREKEKCTFSRHPQLHNEITFKAKNGCEQKICQHVVICGAYAKPITCKAKNGSCDGYDAGDCKMDNSSDEADTN